MFILSIIVDIVDNLLWLRYGHDLAVCHIIDGVGNHIGLLMKLPLSIVRVDGYIPLNEPGKSKNHMDPLQVRSNKRAGSSNCTIGGIGHLESQLMLVVSLQSMIGKCTECSQNGFTGPKI